MELAAKQILTQWSEARHLRPEDHPSDGTVGAGYQRIPGNQLPVEHDLHVLIAEGVANSAVLALVAYQLSLQSHDFCQSRRWWWLLRSTSLTMAKSLRGTTR